MRTAFIETLTELAAVDKNIFLLTGDLGFSFLEDFAQKFPEQYLNCGVSEQNMIGMSAGLALSGKIVFAYSIVPFITLRCLEQVRNDVCLQNANVKLIGVGEGFTYGQLGPTHHSIEDIAVMRALPNLTVVAPGDPWEVRKATTAASKVKTPVYIRLGKKGEKILHKKDDHFSLGRGIVMNEGKDVCIVATGNMLESAIDLALSLEEKGLKIKVISMHTVKPLDENLILNSAKQCKFLFSLEEHSLIGGLGSAISSLLAESNIGVKFKSFGVKDKFTKMAGSQQYLRKVNGLATEQIAQKILKTSKNG